MCRMGDFRRFQLIVAHGDFASGEIADTAGNVFNSLHGAGAKITNLHAGADLVIFLDPVGVERRGKIGAAADQGNDVLGVGSNGEADQDRG